MAGPSQDSARLYLDNAATSFPKPPAVIEAMVRYAREIGVSPGRGAYDESARAGQILTLCRRNIARLFNAPRPESIVFTHNGTDSLNIAIHGAIDPARPNHLICTAADHNSVLRPMSELARRGLAQLTILPIDPKSGLVNPDDVRAAIRPETRLIALPHAGNVNGAVQPIGAVADIARERDVLMLVDAAQSAGHLEIDLERLPIDLLACSGHKGLLGPAGTGVLFVRPGVEDRIRPLRYGGTGSFSEDPRHPSTMPDRYEAGTHNTIGIAGLNAGVEWVLQKFVAEITRHAARLRSVFLDAIERMDRIRVVAGDAAEHVGLVSIAVEGHEPAELSAILESSFDILTRSGLHCAPLAHTAFGTRDGGGATRFSFGPFNTETDAVRAARAVAAVAGQGEAASRV